MAAESNSRQGRLTQVRIYVGKFFRIFLNEKNWKTILFAVVVSLILSLVLGDTLFITKESTRTGFFAIVSVCIWIGIFNSIQEVCKERGIIKREHRTGLHMSAYVAAHMIYQAALCLVQTLVMLIIYSMFMQLPVKGLVTPSFHVDFAITLFLILYAADMLGIAVSALVKTTTAAMTVMPFLLIVQLIFSGSVFPLTGNAKIVSDLTISKWGQRALCIEANLNELPSEILDSELDMLEEIDLVRDLETELTQEDQETIYQAMSDFVKDYTYRKIYTYDSALVTRRWGYLAGFALLYALIALISLEFIDRDKR